MTQPVRPLNRTSVAWRLVVAVVGIGLLLNGSLWMKDVAWPFGPLSQYAFAPGPDDTIEITRVEGLLADGRRIDLPLRVETAGISRAEIEARKGDIVKNPALLNAVADGWSVRHPADPAIRQVWLVQDQTQMYKGIKTGSRLVEIVTWQVPR